MKANVDLQSLGEYKNAMLIRDRVLAFITGAPVRSEDIKATSAPNDSNAALAEKAEQGHVRAQWDLGVAYSTGQGVPNDDAEAYKWFRKAAEQGHVDAQHALGWIYAWPSRSGVPMDDVEALKWFGKAAEQGHVRAQYDLGKM
jgi:TPR repeat protein